jgi:hypothetical protein
MFGNMLGNTFKIEGTCWGTHWELKEHDGKTMGSTKIQKER